MVKSLSDIISLFFGEKEEIKIIKMHRSEREKSLFEMDLLCRVSMFFVLI